MRATIKRTALPVPDFFGGTTDKTERALVTVGYPDQYSHQKANGPLIFVSLFLAALDFFRPSAFDVRQHRPNFPIAQFVAEAGHVADEP